jgi:hypothetical protein
MTSHAARAAPAPRLPLDLRPTRAFPRPSRALPMPRVPRHLVLRAVPYAPRYGLSVRPPFVRSRALPRRRRWSSRRKLARTSPIKGPLPLCLARRAASSSCAPLAPRRRRPPRRTQGLIGRVSQPRRPPPSLAPASAHRLVPLSHRAATSPKPGSRRPPPAVAAARSCRRCLRPDSAWRSSLGDPEPLSACPRPATPTGSPEFR